MIKHRKLGNTGLEVSEIGLGGLFVSSHGGGLDTAGPAIQRALELGVNYIDTAPGYANSEEVLGNVLEGDTRPLIFSTKLGGRPSPFEPQNKDALLFSMEESLRLLKRESVDILMVHEPDRPGQYDWWTDRVKYHGPVVEVLEDLKARGLIRFTGLGGTTAYEMANVMAGGNFDVVLTAFNYSLLWREAENAVLPKARELGMGVIIGSPLQQGALAQRFDAEVQGGASWMSAPRRAQYRELYKLLDEIDISLPELGLRFVLSNPDVASVLMGARSAAEVDQNVAAAGRGPLPEGVLKRLDDIAALVPFRPCDEPASLPFRRDYVGPGPMH